MTMKKRLLQISIPHVTQDTGKVTLSRYKSKKYNCILFSVRFCFLPTRMTRRRVDLRKTLENPTYKLGISLVHSITYDSSYLSHLYFTLFSSPPTLSGTVSDDPRPLLLRSPRPARAPRSCVELYYACIFLGLAHDPMSEPHLQKQGANLTETSNLQHCGSKREGPGGSHWKERDESRGGSWKGLKRERVTCYQKPQESRTLVCSGRNFSKTIAACDKKRKCA